MALVGPLVAMVMMAMLIMVLHRGLRGTAAPSLTTLESTSPPEALETNSPLGSASRGTAGADLKPPRPTLLTDCITDDYGLLATAAVARTHADALLIKEHLRTAGIRATLANAPDGQIRVLVFGDEAVRARRLVS